MQQDLDRLRSAGKRISLEAESFLAIRAIGAESLERLLAHPSPILGLQDVQAEMAESAKVPEPIAVHEGHPASAHEEERKTGREEEKKIENVPKKYAEKEIVSSPPASSTSSAVEVAHLPAFHPIAKDFSPRIKIHDISDVSGQSRCVGSLENFVAYFNDRFTRLGAILEQHQTNLRRVRTDQLSQATGEDVRVIAMVSERRVTKNGNLFIEFEDPQGHAKAILSSRERSFEKAKSLLRDDVVALDGRMGPNFFSVKDITWPDLPVIRAPHDAMEDLAIVYLSDLHVGSKLFLEKNFKRFIRWLWGEEGRPELAGKVKYIVVAGDVADGIGVYPAQEKELSITDIFEQYAAFDKLVEALPDWVEVIVSPGNHDAVRRSEPQPILPLELVKSDVKKIGSPAMVDIEALKHLVYHGTSMDSMIANVPGLSYTRPETAMREMLIHRHLSPVYGENPIVPERRDYMLIADEPDVMHMGHLHKNGAMKYRGTLIVNSGTFQDRTEFQVRMGHVPTPGIVPVLELKNKQLSHLNFMEEKI